MKTKLKVAFFLYAFSFTMILYCSEELFGQIKSVLISQNIPQEEIASRWIDFKEALCLLSQTVYWSSKTDKEKLTYLVSEYQQSVSDTDLLSPIFDSSGAIVTFQKVVYIENRAIYIPVKNRNLPLLKFQ